MVPKYAECVRAEIEKLLNKLPWGDTDLVGVKRVPAGDEYHSVFPQSDAEKALKMIILIGHSLEIFGGKGHGIILDDYAYALLHGKAEVEDRWGWGWGPEKLEFFCIDRILMENFDLEKYYDMCHPEIPEKPSPKPEWYLKYMAKQSKHPPKLESFFRADSRAVVKNEAEEG